MSDPSSPHVLTDVQDGIAVLTLNRPDSSNSLDADMLQALHAEVLACHGNKKVRVVLLKGAGANFCAGGDVKVFLSKQGDLQDYVRLVGSYLDMAMSALIHLKAPVVSAVQGFAAGGGGIGLVCSSDIVVAGEGTRFLSGATRVGMAPDAGTSVSLSRIIGFRRAMEFVLLNPVMASDEAQRAGLVNRVVADDQIEAEAMSIATKLAASAPLATASAKRLMWAGLGSGIDAAMREESRTVAQLCSSSDVLEGLAAVVEKRKPLFEGR